MQHVRTTRHATPSHRACSRNDVTWRAAILRSAGIGRHEARAIAGRAALDVHALISLVDDGCPVHLALRIVSDDPGCA